MVADLLSVIFGIQFLGWSIGALFRTERFYDLTGSATYIIAVLRGLSLQRQSPRCLIQALCVMIWATRLGCFLFYRISSEGRDKRFDGVRERPLRFLVFWILQGVWVTLTLSPTLVLLSLDNEKQQSLQIGALDICGWITFSLGFLLESMADFQKHRFRSVPANKDKFVCNGVWAWSRHPNYLGEILLWIGLALPPLSLLRQSTPFLTTMECALRLLAIAVGPVFDALLICCVSGIPLLERSAEKWGDDPAYRAYVQSTKLLVPFLW